MPVICPSVSTPKADDVFSRRRRWLIGVVCLLALLIAAGGVLGYRMDASFQVRRGIAFFREAGPWPFFIAMAVLPAVGFPLSPFALAAGPVFGPTLGVGKAIL